ncbi:hypothetical protein PVAND_002676 [Polypedilum vanderplanki]|uniref:Uncharacterized protein n=1 Tax=Polypedilum vanderplanki TaxID=319348 RepID=A0A9J6BTC1_POLVA|nr:hypothetical protein PVAND_002676 [Polypedilum vanderplanki]
MFDRIYHHYQYVSHEQQNHNENIEAFNNSILMQIENQPNVSDENSREISEQEDLENLAIILDSTTVNNYENDALNKVDEDEVLTEYINYEPESVMVIPRRSARIREKNERLEAIERQTSRERSRRRRQRSASRNQRDSSRKRSRSRRKGEY